MTIRNLEHAFAPRSVAVFGASVRDGSVGRGLRQHRQRRLRGRSGRSTRNIAWPGNAARRRPTCQVFDLASRTPPETVPAIVRELATRARGRRSSSPPGSRAITGCVRPCSTPPSPLFSICRTPSADDPAITAECRICAYGRQARHIALLSQSGAIATSLIDWQRQQCRPQIVLLETWRMRTWEIASTCWRATCIRAPS